MKATKHTTERRKRHVTAMAQLYLSILFIKKNEKGWAHRNGPNGWKEKRLFEKSLPFHLDSKGWIYSIVAVTTHRQFGKKENLIECVECI